MRMVESRPVTKPPVMLDDGFDLAGRGRHPPIGRAQPPPVLRRHLEAARRRPYDSAVRSDARPAVPDRLRVAASRARGDAR
jgi:hypothetical protein